jgi:2-keto-4-pentenoate hydratase/2-oxohepta-3-ene-1,7-dioic acid hydratase in catechol pathway
MIIMKLVKFNLGRLGALQEDSSVIDLNYAYAAYAKDKGSARPQALADAKVPSSLHLFIIEGDGGVIEAKKSLEFLKKGAKTGPNGEKIYYKPAEVKLLAPLPSMGNKLAMAGANFYDHSLDAGRSLRGDTTTTINDLKQQVAKGEYRAWGFWKQSACVIGPDSETPYPTRTQRLDYEAEVGAVIGADCIDVKEEDAAKLIYGYTIVNDLSIRDGGGGQGPEGFFYAKNFKGSAPMGPCIVTVDEIKDVYKLKIRQWVNGELRQNGSMESMIRGFEWWLAYLSRDMPFHPGDIICGGTCSGTAMDQTPRINGKTDPKLFLKPGDEIEARIEGIGSLKTKIVPKQ